MSNTAPAAPPAFAVLMVCTGNICRSPTADGLLRHQLRAAGLHQRVLVDSAGTHDYHIGKPPDRRSIATARRHGVDLGMLRARQVTAEDFRRFDLILAMDAGHYELLLQACPPPYRERVRLYLDFAPAFGREVPDPYYGEQDGFDLVYRMCLAASAALVTEIQNRLGGAGAEVTGK